MNITPSTSASPMLKAQQALEARRARSTAPAHKEPAPIEQTIARHVEPDMPSRATSSLSPQWQQTVLEVKSIAAKAGYIDVSEQDIRRAYTRGESLLADYRV